MHDVTIIKLYKITSLIRDSRGLSLLIMTGTWVMDILCARDERRGVYYYYKWGFFST